MSGQYQEINWNLTPEDAKSLQESLKSKVEISPLPEEINLVAGADISFNKYEKTVYAGIIVLDVKSLKPYAHALAVTEVHFPYVPGLLSFREIPALLEAWSILEIKPDVLIVDGHGIAHPRRMGIATHFGLTTETPTIGVAKKKLFGKYQEPPNEAGEYANLMDKNELIGYVYRTKKNTKPVFVSPGHKSNLADSLQLVRRCTGKYRIPEPTRQAHLLVNQLRRDELKPGFKLYNSATPLFP